MKLVQMLWDAEKSRKNVGEIMSTAQELLRRCNAFAESFTAISDAFETAARCYSDAKSKLIDAPGGQSIVKAAKTLLNLGVDPKTKQGKPLTIATSIIDAR